MKTIEVSDEDYVILMELSKELQTQDNNGQAFPYFWEPSSEKLVCNVNDEGEEVFVYDYDSSERYSLEEYSKHDPKLWKQYLVEEKYEDEIRVYDEEEDSSDWFLYVKYNADNARVITQDWERKCEHNPSLFMSDVKNFCETNQHHLGRHPHTYSHSFFRMPKMEALVVALCRLNKQPIDTVCEEARRFIYKEQK